ncbi:putative signal transducing protein [Lutibacter sp. Hel_I_33_5]|uniref:putative signal transducing protein n=1 Tax=Lutibacter sp. Hel_I_33_5 TaxID=1566289 RepID=UPI0011ABC2A2|nr:DUF2007 domain-containing protein [Lutibacter sp. Hel_I_33_5]TVZ57159.1 putative signal transducing protein [Lutibacter sp. Hel_I_33_5]
MSKYIKVFTNSNIIVNRLKDLLEDTKIVSIVKDKVHSAVLGGFGSLPDSVELYILNEDLEKATPIIENYRKEITE